MISRTVGLFLQILCLVVATTIAAGGGQYPGNASYSIFYFLKIALLCVPIFVISAQILLNRLAFHDIILFLQDNIFIVLFILTLGLSVPLSAFPAFSLQRYGYTLFGFASLCAVALQYRTVPVHTYALHGVLIGLCLLGLIALGGLCGPFPTLRENVQYFGLVHPNMLSSLLAQILLIIVCLRRDMISGIISGLLGIAIIMLYSRGVWISLTTAAVTCLVIDILMYHSKRSFMTMAGGLLGLLCLVLSAVLYPPFGDMTLSLFTRSGTIDDLLTLTNRLVLWDNLFQMLSLKQFLVGHGYALMAPSVSVDFGSSTLYGAHNAYLSVFLGAGILPCLCLIVFIATTFAELYRLRHALPKPVLFLIISSMVMLLTHGLVAEEFGLHITPTFCLMLLTIQWIFRHENLSDRL